MHHQEEPISSRKYLWRGLAASGAISLIVVFISSLMGESDLIYRENGILESLSVAIWGLSASTALWLLIRPGEGLKRAEIAWLALIATLALMRELDLQIWLNPQKLGAWGVRYRLRWWLSGEVSLFLKLGWGIIFLGLATALISVPMIYRVSWWKAFKEAKPSMTFLVVAVVFLLGGAAIDDRLRTATFIPLEVRQLCEETSEMCGAAWFFAAIAFRLREKRLHKSPAVGS